MVFLSLFLLAGIDQTINPKSKQTIGRNVKFGLTDEEIRRLTEPVTGRRNGKQKSGLGFRKTKARGITF